MKQFYVQDPLDRIEYLIDWSGALYDGRTISSSVWTVPTGISITGTNVDGPFAVAQLSGGVKGKEYKIENKVVLSDGQSLSDSITIYVEEK